MAISRTHTHTRTLIRKYSDMFEINTYTDTKYQKAMTVKQRRWCNFFLYLLPYLIHRATAPSDTGDTGQAPFLPGVGCAWLGYWTDRDTITIDKMLHTHTHTCVIFLYDGCTVNMQLSSPPTCDMIDGLLYHIPISPPHQKLGRVVCSHCPWVDWTTITCGPSFSG